MRNRIVVALLLFCTFAIYGQNPIIAEIDTLIKQGKQHDAIYLLQKTLEKAQRRSDTITLIKIYNIYFQIYKNTYPIGAKKFLFNKINLLQNYSTTHKNENLRRDLLASYFNLAEIYELTGDYYHAINIYNTILNRQKDISDKELIYYKIAYNYYQVNDFQNSLNYIQKLQLNSSEIKDTASYLNSIYLRGKILRKNYLYSDAVNDLLISYFIATIYSQKIFELQIALDIADIFSEIEIYHLANKYYQKVLNQNISSVDTLLYVYVQLSHNLTSAKLYDSALYYTKIASAIAIKNNKPKYLAQLYNISGQIYILKKQFEDAKQYISKAILISSKSKDTSENINAYFSYAILNYYQKNYSQTLYYLNKVLPSAQKQTNFNQLKQIYKLLYLTNLETNNLPKSIYYSDLYNQINDTLTSIYKKIAINKIEAENTLKTKTYDYETKLNILKKQRNRLIWFIAALVFLLLLVGLLVYSYFRKNSQLAYTKQKVLEQNETINKQYEKNKLLSLIANNSTNSMFILDKDCKVIWVNDVLLKLYNTTRDRIFKEKNADFRLLTKGDFEQIQQKCKKHESFVYTTSQIIDGQEKWIRTSISPIVENNDIVYYIGIENDITDLVKAQKEIEQQKIALEHNTKLLEIYNRELKEQKEEIVSQNEELRQQQEELILKNDLLEKYNQELKRLSVAVSETDNMIYFFDLQGNIFWANDAFVRYTGYTLEEFIQQKGRNITEISSVQDIDYYFYMCIEQKKPIHYISEFTTKFGKKIWLQTTLTPIKDENGKVIEIVGIDSDITDTKKAQLKILEQNEEIRKSLEYAQRIQKSVLPVPIFIDSIFNKYFIFYKPRDIVSGDFYYVAYKNDKALVVVADCTGHGIPGALMSILGSLAIQNTLVNTDFTNLKLLLTNLNNYVNKILHKYTDRNISIDSIDIGACVIDFKNETLDFVGANIPLFLYKKNNQKLYRTKPSNISIGTFSFDSTQLTQHTFKFEKGDRIFLATDGFADQFGGRDNKRLRRDGFIEMLTQFNKDEFSNFYNNIENFLHQWMGPNEQIDDILVFGIEL